MHREQGAWDLLWQASCATVTGPGVGHLGGTVTCVYLLISSLRVSVFLQTTCNQTAAPYPTSP